MPRVRRILLPALLAASPWACVDPDSLEPIDETPRAAPIGSSDAILGVLQASLPAALASKKLSTKANADFVNALAWAGEHPFELRVGRGRRGQISRVSAPLLAYDATPQIEPKPSKPRAEALFATGGLGRTLLALSPSDTLAFVGEVELFGGEVRFDFVQRRGNLPVHGATAHVVLDAQGRLRGLDATTIPAVAPKNSIVIDSTKAADLAIADLIQRNEPLWRDAKILPTATELVIVDLEPYTSERVERHAWRVRLAAEPGVVAGDREVLVDTQTGAVIASIEHAAFALDFADTISPASGAIGRPITISAPVWHGTDPCPAPDDAPQGDNPAARDLDEAKAALCEAVAFVEGATGTDAQAWFDSGGEGIRLSIGATPGLSVAMNRSGAITFAVGVARAEIVGHELWHSVMGPSPMSAFTPGTEGAAIEEHMGDIFGMLLERRMPLRREDDDCRLNDDVDTQQTIGMQVFTPEDEGDFPFRPCAYEGVPKAWRNTCDPMDDNGGWCEGPARYGDMAATAWDAYGTSPMQASWSDGHIPSHTNLGIGNRAVMATLGEDTTISDWRFDGVDDEQLADVFFEATRRLPPSTDWAQWADAWLAAAGAVEGGMVAGPVGQRLRAAFRAADLWTVPSEVMPRVGSATPAPAAPAVGARPSVASVVLPSGRERTYVFYRQSDSSSGLRYVWRDEPAGAELALATAPFTGPCTIPDASSWHAPAAVGRDDGSLFVAYNDATTETGVGQLRVLSLAGPAADNTCDDAWLELPSVAERELVGAPAVAMWTPASWRTICEALEEDFPGLTFPFRTLGSMGLTIGDCVDIGERIPPLDPALLEPGLGSWLFDKFEIPLDSLPGLGSPASVDPWNPGVDFGPVRHAVPLVSLFAKPDDGAKLLGGAKDPVVGPRLKDAFASAGLPDGLDVTMELPYAGLKFGKDGLPEGPIQTVEYRFRLNRLVVAFRDPEGRLRAVPWTDPRETDGEEPIPVLAEAFIGDPVLATASVLVVDEDIDRRVEIEYLYTLFVHGDPASGVGNRLSYRVSTIVADDPMAPGAFSEALFTAPERLDLFTGLSGERREIDWALARTIRTPLAVGQRDRMHLFVVSQQAPPGQPPDALAAEAPRHVDRVRWGTLVVHTDGTLSEDSERPVLLPETFLDRVGPSATAGAVHITHQRERLEWYYPRDLGLGANQLQRRALR